MPRTPLSGRGSRLVGGVGPAPRHVGYVRTDAAAAALALVGALVLAAALVAFQGSAGSAYDFAAYFHAAQRLTAGQSLYQAVTQQGPFAPGPAGLYLYPPPMAVLLRAIVPLGATAAALVWQALHIAALVLACAVLPVPRWVRLATFGVAGLSLPVLLDLNLGNVSLFVLLTGAVAWRTAAEVGGPTGSGRERRTPILGTARPGWSVGAGVLVALAIAVRPEVGILLLWWAWRRQWAPLLAAIVAGLALAIGSTLVAGIDVWQAYGRLLLDLRSAGTASSDVGFATVAARLGLPEPLTTFLFVAGAVLAMAAVLAMGRREREAGLVTVMTATLLVVPLLWPHYLVLLLLPGALLAAHGHPWGLVLPLLAWLPGPALPLLAVLGCWAPLLVRRTAAPQREAPSSHAGA